MNDYVSILPLQPSLDRDGVRRLARHSCLDIHRVEWCRSYLATDGTRMLCWYRALDAESVRLVLRQQDAAGAQVWGADPGDDKSVDVPADDCVIVEIDTGGPDPDTLVSDQLTSITALQEHGQLVSRSFASRGGQRLALVCEGLDVTGISEALESEGITASAIWSAVEIDPQPTDLFAEIPPATTGPVHEAPARETGRVDFDAIVIGAGIAGICALQRLLSQGLSVRVYESASDVGGVWHWNRYPGARVDSETYTYAFSIFEQAVQDWDWPELFCAQPDIESYLQYVVERCDLRRHIRFDTRVETATYDEAGCRWSVGTDSAGSVSARYLIAAQGSLSAAQLPGYPGIHEFGGASYHTARWPAAGVEMAGRRVGVIGTGASGVQVIQTIAPDVAHLAVFQRTPTYCIPQRNRVLSDEERRQVRQGWAGVLDTCRQSEFGFIHLPDSRSGLAVSAAEREAKFEELWEKPGFAFWMSNFADLMMNDEVNTHACEFVRRKIASRVKDPEVARRLMPDHPFGTKRVPLENGYYETFNRDNVRLVDVRETPIERITAAGIRTTREEHSLDVIIYATGFDAGTGALTRIDLRGKGGRSLEEKWRDGASTYLGMMVSGFPNLFLVNGPQNAAALSNATRSIEQNVDWIARCIEHLRNRRLSRIEATAEAEREWSEHVDDIAGGSVLGRMTDSWFFGTNTPGKPRRALIYAAGSRHYRELCESVEREHYPGLTMS